MDEINKKLDYIITLLAPKKHNVDSITYEYITNKTPNDFKDLTTTKAYDNYTTYINNTNVYIDPVSIRVFNNLVRECFPTLTIRHTTKNKKQLYIWR